MTVNVGARPKAAVKTVRPRLVIVGTGPWSDRFLVDALPHAKVKESRYAPHNLGVEHLRFVPGQAVGALPGLDSEQPSLVRDAVALALCSGCPSVDVLMARSLGSAPWDLSADAPFQLLVQALGEVPGTVVVFPDAAGVPDRDVPDVENLVRVARRYGPALTSHFQTGVLDLPVAAGTNWTGALGNLRHHDFALASWTGDEESIRRHGWRSAAAFLGGRIAMLDVPMHSVLAAKVPLPGGRTFIRSRRPWLGEPVTERNVPGYASRAVCEVRLAEERGQTVVSINSEPTLREPIGLWDIPLLRTSKVLHHRIVLTANLFVFREANQANALLLQSALQMALEEFVRREVLSGPGGAERPEVHCVPDVVPGQPALLATVAAFLKPWVREMRLEISVQPGRATLMEVA